MLDAGCRMPDAGETISTQWTLGQLFFYREEAKRAKDAKDGD
jgi:hypothetical protein